MSDPTTARTTTPAAAQATTPATASTAASVAIIIPAAGFGTRMGQGIAKQFITVRGKTILARTVDKMQLWAKHYQHNTVIMVALSQGVVLPADVVGVHTCLGGKERADSVANALAAVADLADKGKLSTTPKWAMVHDAARPLVSIEDIEKLYQTLKYDKVGGILAEKITATVKRAEGQIITATVPREDLWLAQTPQLFRFALLRQSLQQSLQARRDHLTGDPPTDEASAIEAMGLEVKIIEGSRYNIKITVPEDLLFC
ncbi:MAG: 2-C-methyl-D-erythritol 4-phosphate cytidylyltransferase [Gammaproteobacteria bacterium]|nr:MAG: 2-C-methyl-D-erythritol 4-phosphate cytidylyltransferase [Gammaproteobacteria bacterium]